MPAVSIKRQVLSPRSINSSTGSLVVPSASSTKDRVEPAKEFRRLLFPTLGLPTIAILRYPSSIRLAPTSGSCETIKSSRSPLPLPCAAEMK